MSLIVAHNQQKSQIRLTKICFE